MTTIVRVFKTINNIPAHYYMTTMQGKRRLMLFKADLPETYPTFELFCKELEEMGYTLKTPIHGVTVMRTYILERP